jgi:hypothetical protein
MEQHIQEMITGKGADPIPVITSRKNQIAD